MEQAETIAGNKLIAEFMGVKWDEKDKMWSFHHLPDQPGKHYSKWWTSLLYHDSWDWLMPVVEKIGVVSQEKQKQFRDYKNLDDPTGWRSWSYRHITLSTNINHVWKKVVDFIKFYNDSKPPQP